jgi:Rieske Fe-S protein
MRDKEDERVDGGRRTWLIATTVAGGIGGVATVVPFVSSFAPSEKAKAAGAPVEVDISDLKPGDMKTVAWRGKPVWIINRTDRCSPMSESR